MQKVIYLMFTFLIIIIIITTGGGLNSTKHKCFVLCIGVLFVVFITLTGKVHILVSLPVGHCHCHSIATTSISNKFSLSLSLFLFIYRSSPLSLSLLLKHFISSWLTLVHIKFALAILLLCVEN